VHMPNPMKVVLYDKYGGADVLHISKMNKPVPKTNEVLVEVHASSINPIDWKIRKGMVAFATGWRFPRLTGADFAGIIRKTGSKVSYYKTGDEIYGMVPAARGGACAEYVTVQNGSFFLKPFNLSFKEAASTPLAAQTALQALRDKGELKKGDQVLIIGASGGVGLFAVQIAKALGARVTGVCSTKNLEFVESIGADFVIDYTKSDPWKLTSKFDLIFDAVASGSFWSARKMLTKQGNYVTTIPSPSNLLTEILTRVFSQKTARNLLVKTNSDDLKFIKGLYENNQLKTKIHRVFPLEKIGAAHRESETGRACGKIVLKIR